MTVVINREKIHEIVELFYQPTSKTFYVNSTDGKSFIKPIGVFVSLGITTSKKVLEEIKNILEDYNYNVVIAEIESRKVGNQYLNRLSTRNPEQYEITDFGASVVYDESESKQLLEKLKSEMGDSSSLDKLHKLAPTVSRLQDLINKLDSTNGWNSHLIQRESENDFKIFHKFINYRKDRNVEYRIGLYVTEV